MVFPARLKHILRVNPLRCCTEDIQAQNHNADCDCVRAHPRQKNNDYWLQCKRKQLGALEEKKALPRGENRNVDSIIHRNYTVYAQNQKHYTALIELRPGEGSCIDVSEHNRQDTHYGHCCYGHYEIYALRDGERVLHLKAIALSHVHAVVSTNTSSKHAVDGDDISHHRTNELVNSVFTLPNAGQQDRNIN